MPKQKNSASVLYFILIGCSCPAAASASEAFVPQVAEASLQHVAAAIGSSSQTSSAAVPLSLAQLAMPADVSSPPPGGNIAQIEQIGAFNSATLTQSGGGNIAMIVQHGTSNVAIVSQSSRGR